MNMGSNNYFYFFIEMSKAPAWIVTTNGVRKCADCGAHGEEFVVRDYHPRVRKEEIGRHFIACANKLACGHPSANFWFWEDESIENRALRRTNPLKRTLWEAGLEERQMTQLKEENNVLRATIEDLSMKLLKLEKSRPIR